MNVTARPVVDRLRASSDLDEKLVTSSWVGTSLRPITSPLGVSCHRKIGDVTPKLPSARSLLNTYGYAPSLVAVTQLPAVHPGDSWVTPGWMSASRYVLPLTSRFPGRSGSPPPPSCASADAGAPIASAHATAAAAPKCLFIEAPW